MKELPRAVAGFEVAENSEPMSVPELPPRQRVAAADLQVPAWMRPAAQAQTRMLYRSPALFLLGMCWRPQWWQGASGESRE